VEGVLRYVRRRGVRMTRPKAEQVVAAAHVALRLPANERRAPLVVLAADWAIFETLDQQIQDATTTLAELLPKTPAGILLGVPGVGMLTASAYGAAIGDPNRYRDAAAAYRASGLVRSVSNQPAGPEPAPGSAAKDRWNCAEPSLIWDAAWACITPTSSPIGAS
jgi:transposase